jgi:hypothetical protein
MRYLLWLVVVAIVIGCGRSIADVAPVTGRVTLDGQPLQFAILTFHPAGKASASGGTDKDGRYTLLYKRGVMGAPIGLNRVTILLDVEQSHRPQLTPTELEREVKPGPNVIDFDLKSDDK